MKIIGVIPARYKSSRFPGKPLTMINGKPMISWVYQQAKKVDFFNDVLIATDSKQIFDVCMENNMNVLMTSETHQTGTDRLSEVAQKINADFYVNIQGDEPLIESETINKVVAYKMKHSEAEVINTMTPLLDGENVNVNTIVKVVAAQNGDLLYLSRSPIPYPKKGQNVQYYRHLGLYGLTREALLFFGNAERTYIEKIEDIEMLRFVENGYKIKVVEVNSGAIGVDCPEDVVKVEESMRRLGIVPNA